MFRRARGFIRGDEGAVAPLVALSIIGLVGMGALAWDVSRAFALRGELDAAVDAAAIAGATQLDLASDAITRATAAAQGSLVTNSQRLANAQEGSVAVDANDIRFLTSLSPSRVYTTDPTLANFIEINLTPRSLGLITGALVRTGAFSVRTHAVAGYGAAVCVVPPLLICNPLETSSVKTFDPDAHIGKTILLTPSGSGHTSPWAPGNFGFLDVGTVPELRDAMARNTPLTQCFGSSVTSEPGTAATVDQWYNTRFDIYRAGASSLSNNALYSPARVTIIGAAADAGTCNVSPAAPTNDCSVTTASGPYGFPIDCDQSGILGTGRWNWQRYFATNHPSATLTPTSFDWTTYGGPNGVVSNQPTRYQVYKWEQALLDGTATEDAPFASSGVGRANPSGNGDWARPNCNIQTPAAVSGDRRVVSAVMTNCMGKNGKFTATTLVNVDLFLTAPVNQSDQTIYGEIIGETSVAVGGTLGLPEKRFWVRLYE